MIKKLVLTFLLLLTAIPARADDLTPNTQEQKEIATYFAGLGSTVGCQKLTHAHFSTINIGELEYLPEKENRRHWSRVFAVKVQTLPKDESLTFSTIATYNSMLINRYSREGLIIETEAYKAADGTPVTYIEYKIRSGISTEHGISVYGRHTDTLAAQTKLVMDHAPFNDQDRATMKQLALTLAARK